MVRFSSISCSVYCSILWIAVTAGYFLFSNLWEKKTVFNALRARYLMCHNILIQPSSIPYLVSALMCSVIFVRRNIGEIRWSPIISLKKAFVVSISSHSFSWYCGRRGYGEYVADRSFKILSHAHHVLDRGASFYSFWRTKYFLWSRLTWLARPWLPFGSLESVTFHLNKWKSKWQNDYYLD